MWTSGKKRYLICIALVLVFGLISGILFYLGVEDSIKDNIIFSLSNYQITPINNIIKHLIILSVLLVMSVLVVGIPLSLFYIYYEGISIGFLMSIFMAKFGLSGLSFSIIYILISNAIYLFLLTIFIKKIFNIGLIVLNNIFYRKRTTIKDKIIINLKNALLILVFIVIYDIFLYFISTKVLGIFAFLLK